MNRMVFLNVTWMERYEGLKGADKQLSGGGSYVDKYGYGHEIYNFKNINNKVYGYAQPGGSNNLERLGAKPKDSFVENVLVVFTAMHKIGGTYVVGWYKNATFYRDLQKSNLKERKFNDVYLGYYVVADAKDVILLPLDKRLSFPKIPRGVKGGLGQSNIWYADSAEMVNFKEEILNSITSYERFKTEENKKRISRQRNVELRKLVEKTAVDIVTSEYIDRGFTVFSVEAENKGWDIEAKHKGILLRIEVKGLSGANLQVELTANEFSKMNEFKENYRLAVVTETLTNPILNVFFYSSEINEWLSENGDILEIEQVISARCSI